MRWRSTRHSAMLCEGYTAQNNIRDGQEALEIGCVEDVA